MLSNALLIMKNRKILGYPVQDAPLYKGKEHVQNLSKKQVITGVNTL